MGMKCSIKTYIPSSRYPEYGRDYLLIGELNMEYVFGTQGKMEILKVKGMAHTDLTGYQEVERKYPDQTITDNFHVVRKLDSQDDTAGNCYDWYEIDRHNRTVDKSGPVAEAGTRNAANIDYLSMMSGINLPEEEDVDHE